MSYVLDIYRNPKENPVQKNPFLVGLYVSLFPQLIAGPIVRYETVAKEMKERHETWSNFSEGTILSAPVPRMIDVVERSEFTRSCKQIPAEIFRCGDNLNV